MQTQELILAVKLRKSAKEIGFEKIILKGNKFIGFFIPDENSAYYQSESFTNILNFIKENPRACAMKEGNNKLTLSFENVRSVSDAIARLEKIA